MGMNPNEIASVVRKKTFAVTAEFSTANVEDGRPPMAVYDEKFSRLVFTIIGEKNGGRRQFVTANVPKRELADMIARSGFATQKQYEKEVRGPSPAALSPAAPDKGGAPSSAYTVRLTAGEHKGKTPAEIMAVVPNASDFLNRHYKWLADNAAQYPNNKRIMDAIMDCSRLAEAGRLDTDMRHFNQDAGVFSVLKVENRPLVRKQKDNGKCFVYEVNVNWLFDDRYPVSVEIVNFYAPVNRTDEGLYNVVRKEAEDLKKEVMKLSVAEWQDIVAQIRLSMRTFEEAYGRQALKLAMEISKKNREAAELPYKA